MNTQSTAEIFNSHNKAIEQRIIDECSNESKKGIVFTTINDDAYNEPIVNLNENQKSNLKSLLNEI